MADHFAGRPIGEGRRIGLSWRLSAWCLVAGLLLCSQPGCGAGVKTAAGPGPAGSKPVEPTSWLERRGDTRMLVGVGAAERPKDPPRLKRSVREMALIRAQRRVLMQTMRLGDAAAKAYLSYLAEQGVESPGQLHISQSKCCTIDVMPIIQGLEPVRETVDEAAGTARIVLEMEFAKLLELMAANTMVTPEFRAWFLEHATEVFDGLLSADAGPG